MEEKETVIDVLECLQEESNKYTTLKDQYRRDQLSFKDSKKQLETDFQKWKSGTEERKGLRTARGLKLEMAREEAERNRKEYEEDKKQFLVEKEKWNNSTSFKIQDEELFNSKIIKLNVGGEKIWTTLDTLTQNPRSRNSLLSATFSGKYPLLRDPDHHILLDRDPRPFKILLSFLRTSYLPTPEDLTRDHLDWLLLYLELRYWGISAEGLLEDAGDVVPSAYVRLDLLITTGPNGTVADGKKFTKISSRGWNCAVRGTQPIPKKGKHYWVVRLNKECNSLMIGVTVQKDFDYMRSNHLNRTCWYLSCLNGSLYSKSGRGLMWERGPGMCYKEGTIVKVLLDRDEKTLGFEVDGVAGDPAFKDVWDEEDLYAAFDTCDESCSFDIESI